jgi:hypothetical protein
MGCLCRSKHPFPWLCPPHSPKVIQGSTRSYRQIWQESYAHCRALFPAYIGVSEHCHPPRTIIRWPFGHRTAPRNNLNLPFHHCILSQCLIIGRMNNYLRNVRKRENAAAYRYKKAYFLSLHFSPLPSVGRGRMASTVPCAH